MQGKEEREEKGGGKRRVEPQTLDLGPNAHDASNARPKGVAILACTVGGPEGGVTRV